MSTQPQVYAAIAAVQAELAKIGIDKTDENKYDKYFYRGIDSLYDTLSPVLAKHGLMVMPRVIDREVVERQSQKGGLQIHTTLMVEYDFVAKDGSKHTIRVAGEALDRGDKSLNKALTQAYKYAMFQALCIPISGAMEDSDGESHEVGSGPVMRSLSELEKQIAGCETLDALRALGRKVQQECKHAPEEWDERKVLFTARAEELKQDAPA